MTSDSQRTLTDADIAALVEAFAGEGHPCRFNNIDPDDLSHSVEFYKNWNKVLTDSRNVAGKTLVVVMVTGLISLLGWGVLAIVKIKSGIGID